MSNLMNSEMNTESKVLAIIAVGELLMNSGAACSKFISGIMDTFFQASQMSINTPTNEEEQVIFSNLRESLIESYITIIHGLNSNDSQDIFGLQIVKYLKQLIECAGKIQLSQKMICMMCELYSDIFSYTGDRNHNT